MRWFPLALLFGAVFSAAQNTPPATSADPGQKIRVEGTVLNLNGDLIRKANVHLQGIRGGQPGQPPTAYSDITDNSGKFIFEDVAPGRYTLSADKSGFVTARYGARSNSTAATQFNLTVGMEMKDLAIKMTPQGIIAGKIVDQDGDPLMSVQVLAMRLGYNGGRKQLQASNNTATNDLGEYRLINLPPGHYYITATDRRAAQNFAQERPGRAGALQEGNITTYYPNAADVSNAVPVDVAAGSEMRGIDIRLLQAKVYSVRGKTVDSSGMPPTAFLTLTRKAGNDNLPPILNGGNTSQTRPDGAFEFRGVIPGTYVLQVAQINSINGNPVADLTGRIELTVGDANIDDLALPLVPRPEIKGTAQLEDGDIGTLIKPGQNTPGAPAAGNVVRSGPGNVALVLSQIEYGPGAASTAQVNPDGTFRFNGVGLSKYAVSLAAFPPGIYLKSARFGGQDVLHAPIDTSSGTGGTLELVLSSRAATFSGSVQDNKGEASAGVTVTLWPKTPDASPSGGVRVVFTDQGGAFKFQNLAPGDYYVAAWEQLEPGLGTSTEFLSHFTSEASSITLAEGGQESKDLKPVPADTVAVEVAKLQ